MPFYKSFIYGVRNKYIVRARGKLTAVIKIQTVAYQRFLVVLYFGIFHKIALLTPRIIITSLAINLIVSPCDSGFAIKISIARIVVII